MWQQVEDKDLYGPFLPNVRDTAIASSYVDENERRGLKVLSARLLNYEQETYEEVTTRVYPVRVWNKKGRVLASWWENEAGDQVTPELAEPDADGNQFEITDGLTQFVKVQHKMNELTARQVLSYGADDAICTAALANHFQLVMEIEGTIGVFHEVETFPAYLQAEAFIQGADFSLADMKEMEADDDRAYEESWAVLRQFLIDKGFDGVHPPVFAEIDAKAIKEAHEIITGKPLVTQVRTPKKLVKLIQSEADDFSPEFQFAYHLEGMIERNDVAGFNEYVASKFSGEPKLDLASPKQMQRFLYDVIGIPVQIVNAVTPTEKAKNPDLADALYRFKRLRMGKSAEFTDKDRALVRLKAKTDDTAIDFAMAFDADSISPEARRALEAVQTMKKVMTRRSLFYKNYARVRHWKDGKIHANVNQCAAVTRRYSMSAPNLQQLPKKGEGVKFRGCFKPHKRNAVICSIDFTGQELRLAAERSQDKNMLACYIGDNLKDIHSITASTSMRLKWGNQKVEELIETYGADLPHGMTKEEFEYRLFVKLRKLPEGNPVQKMADDLRKDSKNINFAAQFGGQAMKLSETLIMPLADAQLFLDARSQMFPDVDRAAKRAAQFAMNTGYALTMMGARRHLRHAVLSDDRMERATAERQAWNMEIQGSAGEQTKLGMSRLWLSGAIYKYDVRFIAPIHDELVTSVVEEHALDFIRIKHECMTGPYADMRVPLLGSISVGPNFAKQFECGDEYIPEKITKALDKIFGRETA